MIFTIPEGLLDAFSLALLRTSSFVAFMPGVAHLSVPMRVRAGLALGLAALAVAHHPTASAPSDVGGWLAAAGAELLTGAAMGLMLRLVVAAAEFAGHLLGLQIGLSAAGLFDPMAGSTLGVIGALWSWMAVVLWFAIGGHVWLIAAVEQSFAKLPVGTLLGAASLIELVQMGRWLFSWGLMAGASVLLLVWLAYLVLAVAARVVPQLQMLAVGFPATIGLGLLALLLSVPILGLLLERGFEKAATAVEGLLRLGG
ncbi:MAG: type III secretion protein [Zetaproteobacteria bacterium]|nr:MAG: type III secretion protein [Zetaproteobacteria bacterium]